MPLKDAPSASQRGRNRKNNAPRKQVYFFFGNPSKHKKKGGGTNGNRLGVFVKGLKDLRKSDSRAGCAKCKGKDPGGGPEGEDFLIKTVGPRRSPGGNRFKKPRFQFFPDIKGRHQERVFRFHHPFLNSGFCYQCIRINPDTRRDFHGFQVQGIHKFQALHHGLSGFAGAAEHQKSQLMDAVLFE